MDDDRLTPDEDATLRRLHALEQLGVELSPAQQALKATLRGRDRRNEVRVPADDIVAVPVLADLSADAVALDPVEW